MAEKLNPTPALRQRIYNVCRGHLHWLQRALSAQSKQPQPESKGFVANYWVTAQPIPMSEAEYTMLPTDALTDTAFQLIR